MTLLSVSTHRSNLICELQSLEYTYKIKRDNQFATEHNNIGRLVVDVEAEKHSMKRAAIISIAFAALSLISSAFAYVAGAVMLYGLYHAKKHLTVMRLLAKQESDLYTNTEYKRLDIAERSAETAKSYFLSSDPILPRTKDALYYLLRHRISNDAIQNTIFTLSLDAHKPPETEIEKQFKIVPLDDNSSVKDVVQSCARLVMDNYRKYTNSAVNK